MLKSAAGTADMAMYGGRTGANNGASNGENIPYSVIHVRRNAPEEILIHSIMAADEDAAREKALQSLGAIAILHICPDNRPEYRKRPEAVASADDYPSARFINGEFHAQTFSDEALLNAIAE